MNPIYLQVQREYTPNNTIGTDEAVIFETFLTKSENIEYSQSNGTIQVIIPGTYLVYWSITAEGNAPMEFEIVSDSGTFPSQTPQVAGQLSDATLINVDESGDTIYLKNVGSSVSPVFANLVLYAMDTSGVNVTTGPKGAQGPTGPQGPMGPTGPQGSQGSQGSQGPQGPQGSQGPTGPQGPIGPQGPTGPQGMSSQGPQGPMGEEGPQGSQGPQGPQGPMGEEGPQGSQGPKGETGPKGMLGPTGETGPQGMEGPKGIPGVMGPQGPQGSIGPAGAGVSPAYGGMRLLPDSTETLNLYANIDTLLPMNQPILGNAILFNNDSNSITIQEGGIYELYWFFHALSNIPDITISLVMRRNKQLLTSVFNNETWTQTESGAAYIASHAFYKLNAGDVLDFLISGSDDITLSFSPGSSGACLYLNKFANNWP